MKTKIWELDTKGYVSIDYPEEVRLAVLKAAKSWKHFCELPILIKKDLPYSNSSAGVGYELKDGSGVKGDKKENFDLALSANDWIEKNIHSIKSPEVSTFLTNSSFLVQLIRPMVFDFAKQVENEFGIEGFLEEVKNGSDVFFIRFIHYFGNREISDETASAHIDQGGFTLHLYESDPGLECLTYDKKWISMPVGDKETVIIPSAQLQLRSGGKLRALAHRVVATKKTAEDGRYSAVCFVQLKNTPKYNKEKWGRLQEMEPGFNYDLTSGDIGKYFKI
ncbi:MAG: 2OG-Fe(II) oxygenase family protein [Parcubacteria group bacterium]